MYALGSGTLWGTPVAGNLPTNPTPIKFGTLQDCSLDISFETKSLYGQNQFPEVVARTKGKISGKAKFGRIQANLFNQLFFGQGTTQPMESISLNEAGTIASGEITASPIHTAGGGSGYVIGDRLSITGGGGTGGIVTVATVSSGAILTVTITAPGAGYTTTASAASTAITGIGTGAIFDIVASTGVTITVANAASYFADLGVTFTSNGNNLIKVASAPATGQYAVNISTGVYTFSSADSAKAVQISYMFLAGTGVGYDQTITNQLMGYQPICTATFHTTFNAQEMNWVLWNVLFSKLSIGSKNDDFTIPEMDFEAFASASGNVIDLYSVQ